MNPGPHPDCPEEKLLREIAAEQRPADDYAEKILHHAAQCSHCGPILSRYLSEFSDEPVPELQGLSDGEPAWQGSLARELAEKSGRKVIQPSPRSEGGDVAKFPVWARVTAWAAPIAAIVVMAVAFGPGLYAKLEFKKTNDFIGTDFANNRHIVMRPDGVPYGAYSPDIHQLGPDANSLGLNRPELAKASGILADHQNTNDPKWSRAEGRIALLKGADGLKQAEDAFDRAKAEGMTDPGIEIDLAVTYFERDSRSDNPNLAPTIDLLNHVLKNPKLTAEQRNTALFDLAIAYEKSNMLDMAADTWAEYLKSDTNKSGGWYKEAEQRLNDLKKKLPPPRASDFRQPGYLLHHLDDPEVQNDIEQFQDFALAHWLPDAFRNPGSDSARAIHAIGDVMEKQHGDTWWRDFLRSTTSQDLPAVEAVSAAFVSSENDFHFQGLQQAKKAEELFRDRNNIAGQVLAKFAEVYAFQRTLDAQNCLAESERIIAKSEGRGYFWLYGQTALEKSICLNFSYGVEQSDRNLHLSSVTANVHNFPELRLRAIGIEAGLLRLRGDARACWGRAIEGLSIYWGHQYSSERLYQFYAVMRNGAPSLNAPFAGEALLRHSIRVLQNDAPNDPVMQAALYRRLAALLYQQNEDALADKEVEKATALLRAVPERERVGYVYYAVSTLALADLQVKQGKAEKALKTIEPLAHILESQPDAVKVDYFRVMGEIRLQSHDISSADEAFDEGLKVAERALNDLTAADERLAWIKTTDELYRGKVQGLLSRGRDRDALNVWEWSRARAFEEGSARDQIATQHALDGARDSRNPGPQLKTVVYASFSDHLQVWVVKGQTVESRAIAVRPSELAKVIRQFEDACSAPELKAPYKADALGERLFSMLINPVLPLLATGERVALELDDSMQALPFEALKSSEGWYLGERFTLSQSPGQRAESMLRPPRVPQKTARLLLADASSSSGEGHLPGHERVVEAVQEFRFGTVVSTGGFSPTSLTSRMLGYDGLVFFGHARRYGSGAALELKPGVLLRPQDLTKSSLSTLDIAVLAACASGSADQGLLDSRSLARAFLSGGVPIVVASRWNVDADTTALLIQKLLEHLPHESPATALQNAQTEIRATYPHPYFWASFGMIGREAPAR